MNEAVSVCSADSYINVNSFDFSWNVHNIDNLELVNSIESPNFTDTQNKCTWGLRTRTESTANAKYFELKLVLRACNESLDGNCFKCKFHLLDCERQKRRETVIEDVLSSGNKEYMLINCLLSEISKVSSPDNNLTIVCNLTLGGGTKNYSYKVPRPSPNTSRSKVLRDLEILYKSKELTDLTLAVDGEELYAHKVILAARSPVFLAMLKMDTIEKTRNKIEITDVAVDVMDEMLYFLYTGKTRSIDGLAMDLLSVADKYDIQELKEICTESLCNELSVKNVMKTYVLADRHNCDELKRKACHFIAGNKKAIIESEEYEDWKNSESTLLCDILMNLI